MKFDVVITTYNRPENVNKLITQLLHITPKPNKILVIDTSTEINTFLQQSDSITYIRSSTQHQNQPYKRLIGAFVSTTENIIFFDDDLEILDNGIFEKLLPLFRYDNMVGFTTAIDFQKNKTLLSSIISTFKNYLFLVTGIPIVRKGKISVAGIYGEPSMKKITEVDCLHGPLMGFKREIFITLPYSEMLTLFDKQLIIPEDKLLSLQAKKYGKLFHYPEYLVRHPKLVSTYFINLRDHTKRVHLSRYFINKEIAKTKTGISKFIYSNHFGYYSFWRKVIATFQILLRGPSYIEKLKGFRDAEKIAGLYQSGNISINYNIIEEAKQEASEFRSKSTVKVTTNRI